MANNCATFEECMLDKRCPFYEKCSKNNPFGEDDRLAIANVPVPVRSARPQHARTTAAPVKASVGFCHT